MILSDFEFLAPENLALCQRVFDQVCADADIDRASIEAEQIAAAVLNVFQLLPGATETELLASIRDRRDASHKRTG
ncbi:hypothetical protein EN943_02195 [Mesorhizobium sp. M7A.F.Ca.US.006.01.1.1]|uniref:hypothetical protein n=1 Tax=Mesorhizobium sp. M7A.F.Ca.US.006.01.1.1 TaxID=2496707 RepID=UPI000FC9BB54|nr:hypothetical protein [Mesorhizobium sp. M7A.F.Ca.US.006.01.1.1]RUZ80895.1 hypothetical protein EN943_02195 [Mesorhizobium sp. M7A.F.Ca.US.006.01.1.1]